MTKEEFIKNLAAKKIRTNQVEIIQKQYGAELPELVQKVISSADQTTFLDDSCRILSFKEMVNACKDLHVDFVERRLLPLADCGENDFIVYHILDGYFSMFNVVEECTFLKRNSFSDILKL